jgi:hypothetical protein
VLLRPGRRVEAWPFALRPHHRRRWRSLVEEDSHAAAGLGLGGLCLGEALPGVGEDGFDLLAGHAGEPL